MNWFDMTLKLLQLAPQLVALIAAVETSLGPGNGAAKKTIVMAPLAAAPADLHAEASTFVDTVVAKQKEVLAPLAANVPVPAQV